MAVRRLCQRVTWWVWPGWAGIMAAKRTHDLIPLCHPLPLSGIDLAIDPAADPPGLTIEATVRTTARTGVEMEALTAVSIAALAVYDMCKAVDRTMTVRDVRLFTENRRRQR